MVQPQIGILGGTFNPVHIGHVRLGIELAERCGLDRVMFMPCLVPPHKPNLGILPFELRVDLLLAATQGEGRLEISTLESELALPSYTWNALNAWKQRNPDAKGIFILGAEDFAAMGSWHRGHELPSLMDFLVISRRSALKASFSETMARLWPQIKPEPPRHNFYEEIAIMPGGTVCRFLSLPSLDISASEIRQKWLDGDSLRYLTPDSVVAMLEQRRLEVESCWRI